MSLAKPSTARYFVIPLRTLEQCPWNPHDSGDLPLPDCRYLGRIFSELESLADVQGLTFYVTADLLHLPSYGNNVVAVVISDEWARHPRYSGDVRAVFKCYGTRFDIDWSWVRRPSGYAFMSFIQDVRTSIARAPSTIAARKRGGVGAVYDFPLGYYRQIDLPVVPINDRPIDLYFRGSIANRQSKLPFRLSTPKTMSRVSMVKWLNVVARRRPELVIQASLTDGFLQTTGEDAAEYSHKMMQTKLCIVPRGTSLETYRFFEGLRCGAVVIVERLPRRWFYDDAPVVRVSDWSQLNTIVPRLLEQPRQLEQLQAAALAWWNSRCSERVIAEYMIDRTSLSRF